jgi:arylsulfatase A-like enzyme
VPTIASWLSLDLPEALALDGVNLAPLIGQTTTGKTPSRGRAIGFESRRLATWTTDKFKLVANLKKGASGQIPATTKLQLFDLLSDPAETKDLSVGKPLVTIRLHAELSKWREAIRKRL